MLKKVDKILLISSLALFVIGLIMVFSASNVASYMKMNYSPYYFFNRQLIFLTVSLATSYVIMKFSSKSYGIISWFALIGFIGLLVFVLVNNKFINEARSWIKFGPLTIQPSEFIKTVSIIWMSYLVCMQKKITGYKLYLLLFAVTGGIAILIVLQPDLGTAIIYAGIIALMFLSIKTTFKTKRNIFISIVAIGLIVFVLLMNNGVKVFFDRQMSRFDFFNPCSEEKFYSTGNQVCNGYIAMNNGGMFGKGLGNSTQKYLYLPYAYTDFIFAIIVEELGFMGAVGVLLLMFIVLWRIFIIGKKSTTEHGKLICNGVFWYILIHMVINLGGITGLIPLTGVPLPFLSYGGSYAMCVMVSLAFVQKVAIDSKKNQA